MFAPWKKSYDKPREHIKKERHHFADKSAYSQSYVFFSGHVWMWELDFIKKPECERVDAFELWFGEDHSWESLGMQRDQTTQS